MTRHQLAKSFLLQNKEPIAQFVLALSEDTINDCCHCHHNNPTRWHHRGETVDMCDVRAEAKRLLKQNKESQARKLLASF